ncbi:hypothetical protein MHI48_07995 [Paenibacillus sp. FSL H7-0942]|uniref:hypothetical protein n=1 Tax=Paenibacillus TaxID=44249 RepID=UPI00096D9C4D|nr:hypothetical protein [Paenibacillus amylolyticus]OMF10114.1 hypothetical protein BK129_04625 [Paenibacillus amylolyticus]
MALWKNEVKKINIENTIDKVVEDYKTKIIKELDIEDMKYEIKKESVKIKEDYPDETVKASCIPNRATPILTDKIEAEYFLRKPYVSL